MSMSLPPGEPAAGPWRVAPLAELVRLLLDAAGPSDGRPRIVAVDGRGAGGKSSLAQRLHAAVPASAVVHTDDIGWHHSFFDWAPLLVDGVLQPVREGRAVRFRPPAWESRGRAGSIDVPAGLDLVLVEGVGAGRRELAALVDAVVWVQSDFTVAERRGTARDLAEGANGGEAQTVAFWHEWMTEELAFLDHERPWERADVVVAGTPLLAHGTDEVVLAPPTGSVPGRPALLS